MQKQAFCEETTTHIHRYDSQTVRRVLARASEIEQQVEPDALTPEQIETLGAELGLSPDAVRRSLGELEPSVTTNPQTETITALRRAWVLSRTQFLTTLLPGLLYAVAMFALIYFTSNLENIPFSEPIVGFLFFTIFLLAPLLLSFWSGWKQKNYLLGGIAGFIISVLVNPAMDIAGSLVRGGWRSYGLIEAMNVIAVIFACIGAGMVGGLLRERKRNKPER